MIFTVALNQENDWSFASSTDSVANWSKFLLVDAAQGSRTRGFP